MSSEQRVRPYQTTASRLPAAAAQGKRATRRSGATPAPSAAPSPRYAPRPEPARATSQSGRSNTNPGGSPLPKRPPFTSGNHGARTTTTTATPAGTHGPRPLRSATPRTSTASTAAGEPNTRAIDAPTPGGAREALQTVGYAAAGVLSGAVEAAKRLPSLVERVTEEAPERARHLREDGPVRAQETWTKVSDRVRTEAATARASVERGVERYAQRGRKVVSDLREDERVTELRDRAEQKRREVTEKLRRDQDQD